jgi:hypothetical protein
MKSGYVKSSPSFFRLIRNSGWLFVALLLVLAIVIPAPLQEPANPAITPNPIRSAWFLLWIQELVSYSNRMIYPVIGFGIAFFALPWLCRGRRVYRAKWFAREHLATNLSSVLLFIAVIALTVIAMFFRGNNWALSFPF